MKGTAQAGIKIGPILKPFKIWRHFNLPWINVFTDKSSTLVLYSWISGLFIMAFSWSSKWLAPVHLLNDEFTFDYFLWSSSRSCKNLANVEKKLPELTCKVINSFCSLKCFRNIYTNRNDKRIKNLKEMLNFLKIKKTLLINVIDSTTQFLNNEICFLVMKCYLTK